MKKAIATVLLTVLMLLTFSACGGQSSVPGGDGTSDIPAVTEPAVGGSGGITLVVWYPYTENDPMVEAIALAADDLKTTFPEITLEAHRDCIDGGNYFDNVFPDLTSSDSPDIAFVDVLHDHLENVINDGTLYELSGVWHDHNGDDIINDPLCNDVTFFFPTLYVYYGLFVNYDLLNRVVQTNLPQDYEDLVSCFGEVKNAGVIPLGFSGQDAESVARLFDLFLQKYVGTEEASSLLSGVESWRSEDVADAADMFQELISAGYFDPEWNELSKEEVRQNFIDGRYVFYIGDAQEALEFSDESKHPGFSENIMTIDFFAVCPGAAQDDSLVVNPRDIIVVSNNSQNREIAAEYAAELARLVSCYGYIMGCGFPAWELSGFDTEVPSQMEHFEGCFSYAKLTHDFILQNDVLMGKDNANVYRSCVERLSSLEIDGTEFMWEMVRLFQ